MTTHVVALNGFIPLPRGSALKRLQCRVCTL